MISNGCTKTKNQFNLIICLGLSVACSKFHTTEAKKGAPIKQQFVKTPEVENDNNLWLEDVYGEKQLAWVKTHNEKSVPLFEGDTRYQDTFKTIENNLLANDRVAVPGLSHGKISNFWADDKNPRGLWRETTLESYKSNDPQWEIILDIDKLNKDENKSWVFHGSNCLEPEGKLCLISLSDGGSDAVVVREFDKEKKEFVSANPFNLPEAKTDVTWVDKDSVLVATNFGAGSLTDSGYARILKLWKRGTPLSEAKTIQEANKEDISVSAFIIESDDKKYAFANIGLDFYTSNYFKLDLTNGTSEKVDIPIDANILGIAKGYLIYNNRSDVQNGDQTIIKGSVIAKNLSDSNAKQTVVYTPDADESFAGAAMTKNFVVINYLKNVLGRVKFLTLDSNAQITATKDLDLPKDGMLEVTSTEKTSDHMIVTYENFLTPTQYYYVSETGVEKLKDSPARFDSSAYVFSQKWATSKDGTKIPYFIVHKKDLVLDSNNPTLLYGYGGFENSLTPTYIQNYSPWLSRGGVFVYANLRGGGEFGPKWHQSAVKENKQKVFDDFYAIAEQLISDKVTSPKRLGVMGGSNGGLLVGAALTQRPDLFNAVVCQVPLLDMLRYHTLFAGASWIAEYGNPDIKEEYEYIRKYSPYQNVKKETKYPKAYFWTTTKDDRVHPSHPRKMVARLEEYGHDVLYFENTEGGHGAGADPKQQVKTRTYQLIYLYQQLMDAQ